MNRNDKEQIREVARKLLRQVWAFRAEWASPDIDEFQVCRLAPDLIVREILKYDLKKVQHISSDIEGFEVAGLIDRRQRKIEISQKTKFETRRFTLAHEIAHVVLHPNDVVLHRDRPFDGSDSTYEKPLVEQQADVFAAELLMPAKLLAKAFYSRFTGCIDRNQIDSDFAFMLSSATSQQLSVKQIKSLRSRDLAHILSGLDCFGSDFFEPLNKLFGVSQSAMAIHLVDHGFVC